MIEYVIQELIYTGLILGSYFALFIFAGLFVLIIHRTWGIIQTYAHPKLARKVQRTFVEARCQNYMEKAHRDKSLGRESRLDVGGEL